MSIKGRKKKSDKEGRPVIDLPPEKAFYFYRNLGEPLGVSAKNLGEFHNKLQSVEPVSVKFHVERGDFQNWLKMLGETTTAERIDRLKGKGMMPDEMRNKAIAIIAQSLHE